MAKTKKVIEEPTEVVLEAPKELLIAEFTGSFGQEDLNKLRDKLNEVVRFLNK